MADNTLMYVLLAVAIWWFYKNNIEKFSFPTIYASANWKKPDDPQCKTVECALAQLDPAVRWNWEWSGSKPRTPVSAIGSA